MCPTSPARSAAGGMDICTGPPPAVQPGKEGILYCMAGLMPAQLQAEWIFVQAAASRSAWGRRDICTNPPPATQLHAEWIFVRARCQPLSLGKKAICTNPPLATQLQDEWIFVSTCHKSLSSSAWGQRDICTGPPPPTQHRKCKNQFGDQGNQKPSSTQHKEGKNQFADQGNQKPLLSIRRAKTSLATKAIRNLYSA